MKRLLIAGALFASFIIAGIFNVNLAYAGTQDFTISNFQVDYYLSSDSEGRSALKTIESITAVFPEYDQNHGIERALPSIYDGHSVSLDIESVKDEDGIDQNYSQYNSNGNLVVRIGKSDEYVHGSKTYVITYTQRDVTKYFADTNDDEFYWDVNGIGWSQPFLQVSATVHIDQSIIGQITGKQSCYYGEVGATATCDIFFNEDDNLMTAYVEDLSAGQNMTIAIGFQPHTFSAYQMTKMELFIKRISTPLAIMCYALLIIIVSLRMALYRSATRRRAVVAEYVPPLGVDLSTSAAITCRPGKIFQAAIISMAVKNNLKITEVVHDFILGTKIKKYNIELLSTDNMTPSEREIAMILFGADLVCGQGSSVDFPRTDTRLVSMVNSYVRAIKRDLREDGYLANKKAVRIWIVLLSIILMLLSIFIFIILSPDNLLFLGIFLNIILCPIIISSLKKKPLNAKGRELYDYLLGLKLFIKTAEQDRIKMLQTPEGAEKTKINAADGSAVLKLYEKLLPYAIIFDLEKEWSKVLATYYESQGMAPVWYLGSGGFSSSSFSSSLSSFSSSLGSSSSSGGSSGGGSSGDGGGGGGGGGW